MCQCVVHFQAGINCDTRNSEGCYHTPLTRAVKLGDLKMVELLTEAGCNLDLSGPAGETPLHIALKEGIYQIGHHNTVETV